MFDKKLLQVRFIKIIIEIGKIAKQISDKGGFWTVKNQIVRNEPSSYDDGASCRIQMNAMLTLSLFGKRQTHYRPSGDYLFKS